MRARENALAALDSAPMAGNDPESWASWHEEETFKLEAESPVAMSRSLWDEIPHSDDSSALFASTPAAEITEAAGLLSCLDTAEEQHCLQEHDSPRQKRRRMLLFPGADRRSEDYERSPDRAEDTDSAWYMDAGSCLTSLEACYEQHRQEPWAANWFKNSCEDQNGRSIQLPACQSAMVTSAPVEDTLGKKARKMSIGPPATGRKRAAVGRPRPVAYPFALLKPCGATGDVTLSDINQRIQTPSPRPGRRMELEQPSTAPVDAGAGLSGKSVVALTKIHTEGNGSITIMRTKG